MRLRPTLFRLLQLLVGLPADHVARYDDVAQALWPDGMYPNDIPDGVQWHARQLNGVLVMVGYAPKAVQVVDRVGLVFEPRALETPGNCTASLHR